MAISTSHASYGAFYSKISNQQNSPKFQPKGNKGKHGYNNDMNMRQSHDGTTGRFRLTTPVPNQAGNGPSIFSNDKRQSSFPGAKAGGSVKKSDAPYTPTMGKRLSDRSRMFPAVPGKPDGSKGGLGTGMYSNSSSTGMSPMRPRTSKFGSMADQEQESPKSLRPASGFVRAGGFDRPGSTTSSRRIDQPPHVPPQSTRALPVPQHGVKSVGGMYGGLLGRLAAKENQDDYFLTPLDSTGDFFAGVADGHGMKGGQVSNFVKLKMKEKARDSSNQFEPEQFLRKAYKDTQEELKRSGIDCNESGTTAVSVLKKGRDLYIANVGDSRAVLLRDNDVVELSNDHKPERRDERERITRHNGHVEPIKAMNGRYVGPARVWVKKQVAGGLAMSRSIGDLNMSRAGVIPDPEIKREAISHKDKYLILGSDGVFEHMENREVAAIAKRYDDPKQASDAIVAEARKKWANNQSGYCDDITALVVKLND